MLNGETERSVVNRKANKVPDSSIPYRLGTNLIYVGSYLSRGRPPARKNPCLLSASREKSVDLLPNLNRFCTSHISTSSYHSLNTNNSLFVRPDLC